MYPQEWSISLIHIHTYTVRYSCNIHRWHVFFYLLRLQFHGDVNFGVARKKCLFVNSTYTYAHEICPTQSFNDVVIMYAMTLTHISIHTNTHTHTHTHTCTHTKHPHTPTNIGTRMQPSHQQVCSIVSLWCFQASGSSVWHWAFMRVVQKHVCVRVRVYPIFNLAYVCGRVCVTVCVCVCVTFNR
jgi:hypothetical protein